MKPQGMLRMIIYLPWVIVATCCALGGTLCADQAVTKGVTIREAVDLALANFPAVQAALASARAARAGIAVAETVYLPRADLIWQENRATDNNVTGLLLPQSVIPSISGPVKENTSWGSVWGSAAGTLLSWEPFDFGRRQATVDVARTLNAQADARRDITRLDVCASAADAFLTLLAVQEGARAARANVNRLEVFDRTVSTLVDHQLRPGADASRAHAELAAARNTLIRAEQSADLGQITLAEALGIAGDSVQPEPGPLLQLPPDVTVPALNFSSHPVAAAQAAAVDTARARERVLERSYVPRVNLQASLSGRGTGAEPDGHLQGGSKGLQPDTGNWATGVTLTFPLLDVFDIRARREAEAGNEAAERAKYEQMAQHLTAQYARAQAQVVAAERIAANTPIQLQAAQAAEMQARARYQASLATLTDVADAERLLAQAEADDAVARLSVWRALLFAAQAQGDLTPFLERVEIAGANRRH